MSAEIRTPQSSPWQRRRQRSASRLGRLAGMAGPVLLACTCLWTPVAVWAQVAPWTPSGSRVFDWGGSTTVQGVPMDVRGFVTTQSPGKVATAVRLHEPTAVETRHGRAIVLGWLKAGHFTTVRIDPAADGGSRGTWAAVPIDRAMRAARTQTTMPAWLPPGSRPGLDLSTEAADHGGRVLLAFNGLSVEANAQHLIARLQAEGFHAEPQRSASTRHPRDSMPAVAVPDASRVLHFSGTTGERAVITLVRQENGETSIAWIQHRPVRSAP